MQALRDAMVVLVVILVIATVRVSPVPEIELSPAQAAPSSARPASGVEAAMDAVVPAQEQVVSETSDPPADDPPCPRTMAVRAKSDESHERPSVPCDA